MNVILDVHRITHRSIQCKYMKHGICYELI